MTKSPFTRLSMAFLMVFLASFAPSLVAGIPSKPSAHKRPTEQSLKDLADYQTITAYFEKKYGIPDKLLAAIAIVESKKSPWAINAEGRSRFFHTKEEAVKHVQYLKQKGVRNINIGYMQINLQSHGRHFKTVGDLLTPYDNIAYAAQLIKKLYRQYGSWGLAVRFYHSGSSVYNIPYQNRVLKAWKTVATNPKFIDPFDQAVSKSETPLTNKKTPLKMVLGPGAGISKKTSK